MPIFMQYTDIPGDCKSKGHDDGTWIEISSFQFGTSRAMTSAAAGSADREGSTPAVSEVIVTKTSDCSSTKLLAASLGFGPAHEGKTVQIDFCKTDTTNPEVYMTITLEEALISSYSMSSGGDRPAESLALNFTKITFNNISMKSLNDTGDPDRCMYDLSSQTGG